MPLAPPQDGLSWTLAALLLAATIAACQASADPGESVEYDIPPLPECPAPVCPPPPECPAPPPPPPTLAATPDTSAPRADADLAPDPSAGHAEAAPPPPPPRSPSAPSPPSAAPSADAAGSRVNINTADVAGLRRLPGVGPKMAARIIETRAKRPFRAPRDLMRVKGIGRATFAKLQDLITVR